MCCEIYFTLSHFISFFLLTIFHPRCFVICFSHFLPLCFFLYFHLFLVIFSRSPQGPDWPKEVPQLQHTDHTCGIAGSLQDVSRAGVAVNHSSARKRTTTPEYRRVEYIFVDAAQHQLQGCRWTERDHQHKRQQTTDHHLPSSRSFASKIAIQGKFYSASPKPRPTNPP